MSPHPHVQGKVAGDTMSTRFAAECRRVGLPSGNAPMMSCTLAVWEASMAGSTAKNLAVLAGAGGDLAYVITGYRVRQTPSLAGLLVREVLSALEPIDRIKLLLQLIEEEQRT